MRSKLTLLVVILGLVVIGGCYDLEGGLIFTSDGMAEAVIEMQVDKYSGGEEARILAWQIDFLFPEVNMNYNLDHAIIEEDWYEYLVINWEMKGEMDLSLSEYFSFEERDDGSYEFIANIPKVLESVQQDMRNETALSFFVEMPKEIDMANTPHMEGNRARWVISNEMLTSPTTLRAFTH